MSRTLGCSVKNINLQQKLKIVSKSVVLLLCRSVDCSRKRGLGRCRGACLIGAVGLLTGRQLTEHDVRDPRFKQCFAIPLANSVFLFFCQSQHHGVLLTAITEEYRSQHFIFVMFLVVFCCLSDLQMSSAALTVYYSYNN
jgi:hypothetical protein